MRQVHFIAQESRLDGEIQALDRMVKAALKKWERKRPKGIRPRAKAVGAGIAVTKVTAMDRVESVV